MNTSSYDAPNGHDSVETNDAAATVSADDTANERPVRRKAPDWSGIQSSAPPTAEAAGPSEKLIISSEQFTALPPDYLIDGILQRRYLYSLTGATGAGKTAIALRLSAHVALGRPLGDYEVEQGRVLYFAGENPDDLRMRWIAMSEHMGFGRNTIDVHFVVGADTEISAVKERIETEVKALGGVALIVVDTSAAYFNCKDCDDENDNVQAGKHARMFRGLTALPGGPTVLVLAHPAKNAKNDNLLPRGGGAFINEVDGNLVARKDDALVEVHWQGKFRGPEFEPVPFELPTVSAAALKDSKGRLIRTVLAVPLSEEDRAAIEARQQEEGTLILLFMAQQQGASMMEIAKGLEWKNSKAQPDKRRVQKGMNRLKRAKLVVMDAGSGRYRLTDSGAAKAETARAAAPPALSTTPLAGTVPAGQ